MIQPLFILCPGRSFSSVVSTMIGQHPDCYGLPELKLFSGTTLGEAWDNDARPGSYPMQGLKRVIAELHHGEQTDETVEEATAWILARRDWTARQVMDHIQEQVGDRILVDKSPANINNPVVLGRIVRAYPEANYLQLLRHPRTRGKSQMNTVNKIKNRLGASGSGIDVDVEFKWSGTHTMIRALAAELALGQLLWIRGEALLGDLELYLPQIAQWLGIRDDAEAIEAMLHPERSPYACIGPKKAKHGNNGGFLKNPVLDRERLSSMSEPSLDGPLDWAPELVFTPKTRRLAHEFGYR